MPAIVGRIAPVAGLATLVCGALVARAWGQSEEASPQGAPLGAEPAGAEPVRAAPLGAGETEAWVDVALHWITRAVEFAGIAVIVFGALVATAVYLKRKLAGEQGDDAYHGYRANLGRSILLGLEFLVAADIIATVAVEPTLESVLVLAGIVMIRTFLSISLEVEIEGRWPWQNAHGAAARVDARREARVDARRDATDD